MGSCNMFCLVDLAEMVLWSLGCLNTGLHSTHCCFDLLLSLSPHVGMLGLYWLTLIYTQKLVSIYSSSAVCACASGNVSSQLNSACIALGFDGTFMCCSGVPNSFIIRNLGWLIWFSFLLTLCQLSHKKYSLVMWPKLKWNKTVMHQFIGQTSVSANVCLVDYNRSPYRHIRWHSQIAVAAVNLLCCINFVLVKWCD